MAIKRKNFLLLPTATPAPINMGYGNSGALSIFERRKKFFELSNHLGNVLVTISDRKIGHDAGNGTIDYYTASVVSANDYYPGGMQLPGRTYTAGNNGYRYSINGQEKTPEIAPNTTTAEFWQYDARIMRRWNVDPKPNAGLSSYATFENNPIWHIDPLGDTVRPGAGFWANAWEGLKQGGRDTKNFVKSLGTLEGWVNVAEGMKTMGGMDPGSIGKRAVMAQNMIEGVKDIPNMNADQWGHAFGYGTEKVAEIVLLSKGTSLASKGLSSLNQLTATKYLSMSGDLVAFEKVEGFSLRFGAKDFVYHNSLRGAEASRWSTPSLFSSSKQAINDLALGYPGSQNTAMVRYGIRNFGIYVKGTASVQGTTLGGGTQLLNTPISLKKLLGWDEFIHFKRLKP